MEISVGMYVRTNDGKIIKVNSYNPQENNPLWETLNGEVRMKGQISKASYDIIDLIHVGDYINGKYVDEVAFVDGDYYIKTKVSNTNNYDYLPAHSIKSIVTKEQFEQIQYRIGD